MGIEAAGTLYNIGDTQQVSERFSKRTFVLELADNPKYPQLVEFTLTGDRCSQLDGMRVGDEVRVEYSLRGREWRSPKGELRYFNSLDVWVIELTGGAQKSSSKHDGAPPSTRMSEQAGYSDDSSEIPF